MMSGNDSIMARAHSPLRFFCALILFAGLAAAPTFASGQGSENSSWSLTDLMHDLARVQKAKATFVELKYLSLLTEPLTSSGTLEYTAPGRLEKHTLLPKPESLVLDQGKLLVKRGNGGEKRTLTLQEHPSVWAFVESIRSTLAGDIETLNRFYRVTLDGRPEKWQLVLHPVESNIQSLVSEILIKGSAAEVTTIEIRETGGDYSVMSISRDDS